MVNAHHVTLGGKRYPLADAPSRAGLIVKQLLCQVVDVLHQLVRLLELLLKLFPKLSVEIVEQVTFSPRRSSSVDEVIEEHTIEEADKKVTILVASEA